MHTVIAVIRINGMPLSPLSSQTHSSWLRHRLPVSQPVRSWPLGRCYYRTAYYRSLFVVSPARAVRGP
jgi:hypothetical protein